MTVSKKNSETSDKSLVSEKVHSWIMIVAFPIALILGTYGYCHYPFGEEPVSITNALYHSAQLFLLHAPHFGPPVPWTLEIARWMAALSTGMVLFNAALHVFHNEKMDLILKRRKKHAIVCGLGKRGIAVAEKLHKSGIQIVAIEKDPEPDVVERLHRLGIPLITGDATREEILQQARIIYADSIFALCTEDTVNFTIAMKAHNMNCNAGTQRKCFIHINDAELRNALQSNYQENLNSPKQNLRFIDAYGSEAISLLVHELPLDGDGISPTDIRQVHLIILGFGCMGRTIAVKAAQLGHFANKKRIRISIIDHHATENQSTLLFHHPFIEEVADFSFYQQEVLSPETRNQIEEWCSESEMIVNVVICFDNPSIAYDALFNLLPAFNRNNVRVAVRMNEPENLAFLLKGIGAKKYNELRILPFSIEDNFENFTDPENSKIETFAMDIHKAYVDLVNNEFKNNPEELVKRERSGELNNWDNLKEDFKESSRQQAIHILFKIRAANFEIVDESDHRPSILEFEKKIFNALAIMEHDRWIAERKVNNWKYGKPSDKANRINEYIIEWDQLPQNIKQYDYDAVSRIPVLLKMIGKKMVEKIHTK